MALIDALESLQRDKKLTTDPLIGLVGAVSVGIKDGRAYLDLDYSEDSTCDTDLNVVMTQAGGFIEIQGTAEDKHFTRDEANAMLDLAESGIKEIFELQKQALCW